jgi:hypothetical protein
MAKNNGDMKADWSGPLRPPRLITLENYLLRLRNGEKKKKEEGDHVIQKPFCPGCPRRRTTFWSVSVLFNFHLSPAENHRP